MGRLTDIYKKRIIDYLASEGKKIASKALASKDAKNRTYNQADAFGYIVFYNGKIERKGYANTTPKAEKGHKGWNRIGVKDGSGREWLDEFIDTWKPESKGFVLIVVNAAFYSGILEQARGSVQRKYRIISQIWSDMETLQSKFKGSSIALKNAHP